MYDVFLSDTGRVQETMPQQTHDDHDALNGAQPAASRTGSRARRYVHGPDRFDAKSSGNPPGPVAREARGPRMTAEMAEPLRGDVYTTGEETTSTLLSVLSKMTHTPSRPR